jgi:hypothetical protein
LSNWDVTVSRPGRRSQLAGRQAGSHFFRVPPKYALYGLRLPLFPGSGGNNSKKHGNNSSFFHVLTPENMR